LTDFDYVRADTLEEALVHLADGKGKVLAGGTDLIVLLRQGGVQPSRLVDISRIDSFRVMGQQGGKITIGAGVTFGELARSPMVQKYAEILAQSACKMGSPQIRSVATLGGNIANGSPAADGVVPLLILDAELVVWNSRGTAVKKMSTLLEGQPDKPALRNDEIIEKIEFPEPPPASKGIFLKLGRRNAVNISRLSFSALIRKTSSGTIKHAALAIGAAGPFPFRVGRLEKMLIGAYPTPEVLEEAVENISRSVGESLGDRSSAPYKCQAIKGLAREGLAYCFGLSE
jgi:nicotinate dehydrogenase FAD-subunit